jgi:hypothetical protein
VARLGNGDIFEFNRTVTGEIGPLHRSLHICLQVIIIAPFTTP